MEKEGPPLDMDALSLEDSGDEGVMIGDNKEDQDMFASALGEPPQVYLQLLQLHLLFCSSKEKS